jgi:hypothetical protein
LTNREKNCREKKEAIQAGKTTLSEPKMLKRGIEEIHSRRSKY